nr:hypothetical protein CFP56_52185 [Quercus suber]
MKAAPAFARNPAFIVVGVVVVVVLFAAVFSGPLLAAPDYLQQLMVADQATLPIDLRNARTQSLAANAALASGKGKDAGIEKVTGDTASQEKDKEDEEKEDEEEDTDPPFNYLSEEEHRVSIENNAMEHLEITSNTTIRSDGKYFPIKFGTIESYNPNIIPHPYRDNTWIIVAQRDKKDDDNTYWRTSLVCEATFVNGTLDCVKPPMNLPIPSTTSELCHGKLEYFNFYIGPHDARVFYGGDGRPFIIYGSQSQFNCLGQFVQDFRRIADWGPLSSETNRTDTFFYATDLQRPLPYNDIEKNYFIFWDVDGQMYIHHDIVPTRVFAKLYPDGSISEDLAPLATTDLQCMEKFMPEIKTVGNLTWEWIHQSTNSLAITLCDRSDKKCRDAGNNTYLFTIFQHKSFYGHGVYEPYLMLFQQKAPFQVHALSSKPFWIPGRGKPNDGWAKGTWKPNDQSQMIFVVSMNWKEPGVGYNGFLDDELLISFGVEDQHSGGISVIVGDLMKEFSYCDDARP